MSEHAVRVHEDYLTIPSYVLDGFDPHPLFDDLYGQTCYPYPLVAIRGDRRKVRQKYLAVRLENEFLELTCFPHFGGRIYSCRDKVGGEDLFHVVERIGVVQMMALAGGSYSGCGMEINFPDAHSLTNVRKREYRILREPDGGATLVIGELELRMRMRWEVRLTLRPGAARLEQEVRVHNRTAMYGRGRYWANPGIPQTPTVEISMPGKEAFEHGGEFGVQSWPVYDGVDMSYPAGVPCPIGFEMKDVRDGYYAYYDHARKFGMVHWAPPDETPGKKYWAWGSSAHTQHRAHWFADGTDYFELQAGRMEDQEEFEIYPPFCMRRWREVWYPIRTIGPVDAAGPDAALSCRFLSSGCHVAIQATRDLPCAEAVAFDSNGRELARRNVELRAGKITAADLAFRSLQKNARVSLFSNGHLLTTLFQRKAPRPDIAADRVVNVTTPPAPKTADDHMMAYERDLHYWAWTWTDFEKSLQRVLDADPHHAAAHRWMGVWLVRRGLFAQAESHIDEALRRNSHDGEANFYKAVCRLAAGDGGEADWQLKMAFRHGCDAPAAFMLGVLALSAWRPEESVERFSAALDANAGNLRGRLYRALALAELGRVPEALADVAETRRRLATEALAPVVEHWIRKKSLRCFLSSAEGRALAAQLRQDVQTWLELICDLMAVARHEAALQLLTEAQRECRRQPGIALMGLYRGYLLDRLGRRQEAKTTFAAALKAHRQFAFTFRAEEEAILDCARTHVPESPVVHHYRALLRASQARLDEAREEWRKATKLGLRCPVTYRALAKIEMKVKRDPASAERLLDWALALAPQDIGIRRDLLGLVKARQDWKKFARLVSAPGLASTRLLDEVVQFHVRRGNYDAAVRAVTKEADFRNSCQEHHHLYELALTARAFQRIEEKDFAGAEADLRATLTSPPNLGLPARMTRVQSRVKYFLGLALRGQGDETGARATWEEGIHEREFDFWLPAGGWAYGNWINRYWQGRMLAELGRKDEATAYFESLLAYAMNKSPTLTEAQRRELYILGRAGVAEQPVTGVVTDVNYLGKE